MRRVKQGVGPRGEEGGDGGGVVETSPTQQAESVVVEGVVIFDRQ